MTTTLVYYKYNSLLYYHERVEMAVCLRQTDRQTAIIDTTLGQTCSEPYFFHEVWYRAGSQRGEQCVPLFGWRLHTGCSPNAWLLLVLLYNFLNAHTFIPVLNSRYSFPLSLIYPKTQVQYPVLEIHDNRLLKVNIYNIIIKVWWLHGFFFYSHSRSLSISHRSSVSSLNVHV